MNKIKFIVIFISSILLTACPKQESKTKTNKNYLVLLDLSDRLLKPMQKERDIELIKLIFESFYQESKSISTNNSFKIAIAPQAKSDLDIQQIENELYINLSALRTNKKRKTLKMFREKLDQALNKLYELATKNKTNKQDFFGADIWQYFYEDIENDLNYDPQTTNNLFIITDGYLYFENYSQAIRQNNRYSSFQFLNELRGNNWKEKFVQEDYGIIGTQKDYPHLNVMVLEICPTPGFLNEYELIKLVWEKWLREMHVSHIEIYKGEPLKQVDEKIRYFIKNNHSLPLTKNKQEILTESDKQTTSDYKNTAAKN